MMKRTRMTGAGVLMVYRTKRVMENLMKWWVTCALEKMCIAPTDRLMCGTQGDKSNIYVNCHRYDQSAMSILLANHYNYDREQYCLPKDQKIVSIRRGESFPKGQELDT